MRRGGSFRVVGLILGIVSTTIAITSIVFSVIGMLLAKKPVLPYIHD